MILLGYKIVIDIFNLLVILDKNFRASNIVGTPKMLVLQEPPIRTDFTSSSSAEQEFLHLAEPTFLPPTESVYQNGKTEGSLRTAIGSSEIINQGDLLVYTFT